MTARAPLRVGFRGRILFDQLDLKLLILLLMISDHGFHAQQAAFSPLFILATKWSDDAQLYIQRSLRLLSELIATIHYRQCEST